MSLLTNVDFIKEEFKKKTFLYKLPSEMPLRHNFEELCTTHFMEAYRWLIAVQRLLEDAKKDGNTDWWNLCSIYGGGFSDEVIQQIRPIMQNYLRTYAPVIDFDRAGISWNKMGFCAHNMPTFLIWQRVYLKSFEILLQHYDPFPEQAKSGSPLMAHYWMWDSAFSHDIPEWCYSSEVYDIFHNRLVPNPLFQGISNEPNREYTIRGIQNIRMNSPFHGLGTKFLNKVNMTMTETNYSRVSTMNYDGFHSLEKISNIVHIAVGGASQDGILRGDISDIQTCSFDPIFWLLRSNLERLHYAWLSTHPVPTEILLIKEEMTVLNVINLPLWPFPQQYMTYENLPWHTDAGGVDMIPTYPTEWLDNSDLDYSYDNFTDVGMKNEEEAVSNGIDETITVKLVIRNIRVHGSGLLHARVRLGDQNIQLEPRAIFFSNISSNRSTSHQQRLTLAWEVVVSLPMQTRDAAFGRHVAVTETDATVFVPSVSVEQIKLDENNIETLEGAEVFIE